MRIFLRIYFFSTIFLLVQEVISAQVGIGTQTPNPSAMLQIESNNKGVLFPRLTAVQRLAISSPADGLIVYDNDSSSLFIYSQALVLWKRIKAINSLESLVIGNAPGDVLVWNGSGWTVTPKSNLFTYFYRDKDGDGFGDSYFPVLGWSVLQGFVTNNTDCNDTSNQVHPGAIELCNGIDDNCNGQVDENCGVDLPDDAFQDINGDGIDGTESAAIFVSILGNDANPGTKLQPKLTINAGINAATGVAKTHVYIASGTYNETVILSNGVSIYGGYSITWSRSATNIAIVQGVLLNNRVSAMEGNNITTPTTVDRLTLTTSLPTAPSISSYGFYCSNCTGTILKNSALQTGNGSNGSAAGSGIAGLVGGAGSAGAVGSCDAAVTAAGGPGGAGTCGQTGGKGGNGGINTANGQSGSSGTGGAPGGFGGSGGDPGGDAGIGGNGLTGTSGSNGAGGSSGVFSSGFWVGGNGSVGTIGTNGNGGGGGGGGGGQHCTFCDDGTGNGGGGGGGGGCGGSGSPGGLAGGGSFGLILVNSTGFQLNNNTISSGNGGDGGSGGNGSAGGNGGTGGQGGTNCLGEVGRGGNGGSGGKGGNGGHGGGGAGGISYAVYLSGTTLTLTGNILSHGAGGAGGTSLGNAGTAGASGNIF